MVSRRGFLFGSSNQKNIFIIIIVLVLLFFVGRNVISPFAATNVNNYLSLTNNTNDVLQITDLGKPNESSVFLYANGNQFMGEIGTPNAIRSSIPFNNKSIIVVTVGYYSGIKKGATCVFLFNGQTSYNLYGLQFPDENMPGTFYSNSSIVFNNATYSFTLSKSPYLQIGGGTISGGDPCIDAKELAVTSALANPENFNASTCSGPIKAALSAVPQPVYDEKTCNTVIQSYISINGLKPAQVNLYNIVNKTNSIVTLTFTSPTLPIQTIQVPKTGLTYLPFINFVVWTVNTTVNGKSVKPLIINPAVYQQTQPNKTITINTTGLSFN
jgi:hypothetical protein